MGALRLWVVGDQSRSMMEGLPARWQNESVWVFMTQQHRGLLLGSRRRIQGLWCPRGLISLPPIVCRSGGTTFCTLPSLSPKLPGFHGNVMHIQDFTPHSPDTTPPRERPDSTSSFTFLLGHPRPPAPRGLHSPVQNGEGASRGAATWSPA